MQSNSQLTAKSAKYSGRKVKSTKLDVMTFRMAQPSLIEASAGTGKTYTITNLILRALLGMGDADSALRRPLTIDEMLIVTFTNAATADLRQRVYDRIRQARMLMEDFLSCILTGIVWRCAQDEASGAVAADADTAADTAAGAGAAMNAETARLKALRIIRKKYREEQQRRSEEQALKEAEEDAAAVAPEQIRQELIRAKNYSDEELDELFVSIDVMKFMPLQLKSDEVMTSIIMQLLERGQGALLRHAISVLLKAERNINNASICTIHSFCHRTLTQIYALESGEAFNVELKTCLQDEEHEAYYNVWRKLFYRLDSSEKLLAFLEKSSPLDLVTSIGILNRVRCSDPKDGFLGFQVEGVQQLLEQFNFVIEEDVPLEEQLITFFNQQLRLLNSMQQEQLKSCYQTFSDPELPKWCAQRVDIAECKLVSRKDKGSMDLNKEGRSVCVHLFDVLNLIQKYREQILTDEEIQQNFLEKCRSLGRCNADSIYKNKAKASAEALTFFGDFEKWLQVITVQFKAAFGSFEECHHKLVTLIRVLTNIAMIKSMDEKCRELHVMSNDDLLHRLNYALNSRADGNELARLIRVRYPLAMIDEFQDTDPVQFQIFRKIYLNQDALDQQAYCYLIGDPKQSIYAFRGSDINSYLSARQEIIKLTGGKGLYTLDTNYRSSPDVVAATNSIFGTRLNPNNINPFDESNISFVEVKSGIGLNLVKALKDDAAKDSLKNRQPMQRAFAVNGIESLLYSKTNKTPAGAASAAVSAATEAVAAAASCVSEEAAGDNAFAMLGPDVSKLLFSGYANTYLASLDEYHTKDDLFHACAGCTAAMIRKVLTDGVFPQKDGTLCPVKPQDIAVLVRSAGESDLIKNALWQHQISSVYMSDRTSVLGSNEDPSLESLELLYLMEAMCDCTNRRKIFRLMGTRMLSLDAQEYQVMTDIRHFEEEVKLLSKCARLWQQYGFMAAFMQWSRASLHNVCSRLLKCKNGERLYTNYCHISEIIQTVHNQKGGIQAQLHWFSELIHYNQNLFDQDVTRKRLESEQEQIRIITIHKSKGLEFPLVFLPFIWTYRGQTRNESYFDAASYYNGELKHKVLDFEPYRPIQIKERLPVESGSKLTGQEEVVTINTTPAAVQKDEADRELIRLLYVALTRARNANFIMVGKVGEGTIKSNYHTDALVNMQGKQTYLRVANADNGFKAEKRDSGKQFDSERFLNAALRHPECFTVVDGIKLTKLYSQEAKSEGGAAAAAPAATAAGSAVVLTGDDEDEWLKKGQSLKDSDHVLPVAMSFLYRKALNKSFNIFSYSSLVENIKHQSDDSWINEFRDFDEPDRFVEDKLTEDEAAAVAAADAATGAAGDSESSGQKPAEMAPAGGSRTFVRYSAGDPEVSASALFDDYWHGSHYPAQDFMIAREISLCHLFPRGRDAGSFMHSILENTDFEQLKLKGFERYLVEEVVGRKKNTMSYRRMASEVKSPQIRDFQRALAEWFNDVVEAPVVSGKHHCLALADLEPLSYEREMEFLMLSREFNTRQIDALCRKVAVGLLEPYPELQRKYMNNLKLPGSTMKGFMTGSIDLACRFDLNQHLKLRERDDLMAVLSDGQRQDIKTAVEQLRSSPAVNSSVVDLMRRSDPEIMTDAQGRSDFTAASRQISEHEGSNIKYFVIDYKSNYLGSCYQDYQGAALLNSIYEHRYDVQFMIYSLALYRMLKRRCSIPFDADKEMLRAFYEQHIGGVMYLFLRGMRANFRRDAVSTGVFTARLDFDIVYELDQVFTKNKAQ